MKSLTLLSNFHKHIVAIFAFMTFACFSNNANALLIVCGIADGAPADTDPRPDFVGFTCPALGAGNSASGTATSIRTDSSLLIRLSPNDYKGVGTLSVSDNYNFLGAGVLTASFAGQLLDTTVPPIVPAILNVGGETFSIRSHATTFNGGDALANWAAPGAGNALPIPVLGFNLKNGYYATQGILTGTATWSAGPAPQGLHFPASVEYFAAAPEPSVISLFVMGAGLLMVIRRRKSNL